MQDTLRFPDFLCIGAQKSGTTWLHENLSLHPEVWLPPVKELQYFNHVHIPAHRAWTDNHRRGKALVEMRRVLARRDFGDEDMRQVALATHIYNSELSDEWYGRVFSFAPPNRICGEITPEYSILPRAGVAHVRQINPNARVIFFMRDPIDRAISHLRMLKTQNTAFDYTQGINFWDVFTRSDFPTIITDWTRAVGRERMLLGYLDDINARPYQVLTQVSEFLGIDGSPHQFPKAEQVVFKGEDHEVPEAIYFALKDKFRPVYDRLPSVIPAAVAERWAAVHY